MLLATLTTQPVIDRIGGDRRGQRPEVFRRRGGYAGELLEAPVRECGLATVPVLARSASAGTILLLGVAVGRSISDCVRPLETRDSTGRHSEVLERRMIERKQTVREREQQPHVEATDASRIRTGVPEQEIDGVVRRERLGPARAKAQGG